MSDMYRVSIRDHRRIAMSKLSENEKCYDSLQNKESSYAKGIKQLQDLHRQVYSIYKNAPDGVLQLSKKS